MKTLYVLAPYSHYCDAARWALVANGEEEKFRLVAFNIGAHALVSPVQRLRGGKRYSLPLLLDAAGNVEGTDSWSILERRGHISPRLKELLDQVVGPASRTIYYSHYFATPEARNMFKERCQNAPTVSFWQRWLWRTPFADKCMDIMYKLLVKNPEYVESQRQKLSDAFDQIEPLLYKPPFTLETTAASIALAALTFPVVTPTDPTPTSLQLEVQTWQKRPAGTFALKMFEKFPHYSHNYFPSS